jgi:hypothetical protein
MRSGAGAEPSAWRARPVRPGEHRTCATAQKLVSVMFDCLCRFSDATTCDELSWKFSRPKIIKVYLGRVSGPGSPIPPTPLCSGPRVSPIDCGTGRRLLFLVVDSGRAPSGQWAQTVPGPSGVDLIMAASDTATESGAIGSYSAFDATMADWKKSLVSWRCGLSEADRHRFGVPPDWNCRDLEFFVSRITFDQLGPDRAAALNAVETRFKLPPDQVEMLIAAGHDALRNNPTFRDFLKSMLGVPTPIATSDVKAREALAE